MIIDDYIQLETSRIGITQNVLHILRNQNKSYSMYDVFMSRWLEREF